MPTEFILIRGRTSRQGTSLNEGKYSDGYRSEINTLLMNAQNLARLKPMVGDCVRMWNRVGEVIVPVKSGKDAVKTRIQQRQLAERARF